MKNSMLLVLLSAMLSLGAMAQDSAKVDKPAAFKGGMRGWVSFLESNLDHSLLGRNGAPEGSYRMVATFTVDSVGGVRDIMIDNDPGYGAKDEFIRILKKSSNKWEPAQRNGAAVSYQHKQSLTLMSRGG